MAKVPPFAKALPTAGVLSKCNTMSMISIRLRTHLGSST